MIVANVERTHNSFKHYQKWISLHINFILKGNCISNHDVYDD